MLRIIARSFPLLVLLSAMPAFAQQDPALLKDLQSVIALKSMECGKVVSATKMGENDYTAVCSNGTRYRVTEKDGKVKVVPQR